MILHNSEKKTPADGLPYKLTSGKKKGEPLGGDFVNRHWFSPAKKKDIKICSEEKQKYCSGNE